MSNESLNKVKWNTFVKQAKGSDITEIHVGREERGPLVVLKYNGKNRKGGRVTGEWAIDREGKDDAALAAAIKDLLERARKDFFVRREGGLQGDAFGSKQEEEGFKAKPIVGEAPPQPKK
jgi:hypothetical protein